MRRQAAGKILGEFDGTPTKGLFIAIVFRIRLLRRMPTANMNTAA